MKKLILAGALLLGLAACSDENGARRALAQQGYTDIQIQGYSWTGCGKDDDYKTKFSATTPAGFAVKGVVCSGWFKGATIRVF